MFAIIKVTNIAIIVSILLFYFPTNHPLRINHGANEIFDKPAFSELAKELSSSSFSAAGFPNHLHPQSKSSFQTLVDYLTNTTDSSQEPCQNFYDYACGGYDQHFPGQVPNYISFLKLQSANDKLIMEQLGQDSVPSDILVAQSIRRLYKECTKYVSSPDTSKIQDLLNEMNDFEAATSVPFVALSNSLDDIPLNSTQVGLALGKLYNDYLLFPNVPEPKVINYLLFIEPVIVPRSSRETAAYFISFGDQLMYFCNSYTNQSKVAEELENFFSQLSTLGTQVSGEVVNNTIQDVSDVLLLIKLNFCSSPKKVVDHDTGYGKDAWGVTAQEINEYSRTIDFASFLQQLSDVAPSDVKDKINANDFKVIASKDSIALIDTVLGDPEKVCGRKLASLFYYNLIRRHSFWSQKQQSQRKIRWGAPNSAPGFWVNTEQKSHNCLVVAQTYMPEAVDHIFMRSLVPSKTQREDIRSKINTTTQYILRGFLSMVEQVSWLSRPSKAKAIAKLDNMAINLVCPEAVDDEVQLEKLYSPLELPSNATFHQILSALRNFSMGRELQKLVQNEIDRNDFGYPASNSATVNAFYAPWLNSITIPMGILQQPMFSSEWPTEWNFGGIGFILGHEITHGFDTTGVKFDEDGYDAPWLDNSTQKAFQQMSECVVEEYSQFCPLNRSFNPHCVNGRLTLAENLADNAGIHAAFRGFEHWKDTVGEEPALPGNGTFAHLKSGQLFFLAMANSWCINKIPEEYTQSSLQLDEHSPPRYRIRGALPNFVGFKNAFECRTGEEYSPKKHCNVWITDLQHYQFMDKLKTN